MYFFKNLISPKLLFYLNIYYLLGTKNKCKRNENDKKNYRKIKKESDIRNDWNPKLGLTLCKKLYTILL
jgi:hypothetical protein